MFWGHVHVEAEFVATGVDADAVREGLEDVAVRQFVPGTDQRLDLGVPGATAVSIAGSSVRNPGVLALALAGNGSVNNMLTAMNNVNSARRRRRDGRMTPPYSVGVEGRPTFPFFLRSYARESRVVGLSIPDATLSRRSVPAAAQFDAGVG